LVGAQDLSTFLGKIKEFLLDLGEIFFLPDGIYLHCTSRNLSSKILIFEQLGEGKSTTTKYLTGPMLISELTNILYRFLRFNRSLQRYFQVLDERIGDIMSREINIKILDYMRYVKFFITMLRKWFNVDISREVSLSELGIRKGGLESVLKYIREEKTKAFALIQRWNLLKFLVPPEGKMRVLNENGLFEYSIRSVPPNKLVVFVDSKRFVVSLRKVLGWLLFLVARNLELEKVRYLMHIEKRLEEGFISKDQLPIILTKELVERGRIAIPVSVAGVRTFVGLRLVGKTVYAYINTGEYAVREILGPHKGLYVYFPPVDICVELRAKNLPDGNFVVYPVEVPVIIDEYLHPSVRERVGKRQVCLGKDGDFVGKLVLAAKEIAEKKKAKVQIIGGFTVISTEHALAEILRKAFTVVRYGYRPGMTPYRSAAACAGVAGVRIISDKRELEELKERGVEIVEQ